MPAEINNSVISAASLTPRSVTQGQSELRSRDNAGEPNTANPQAVLASHNEEVVRSPDPGTSGQATENQLQQNPQSPDDGESGVGGNVDVTI